MVREDLKLKRLLKSPLKQLRNHPAIASITYSNGFHKNSSKRGFNPRQYDPKTRRLRLTCRANNGGIDINLVIPDEKRVPEVIDYIDQLEIIYRKCFS